MKILITVKLPDSKFIIDGLSSDSIGKVKARIYKEKRIPSRKQTLFYDSQLLKNSQTLNQILSPEDLSIDLVLTVQDEPGSFKRMLTKIKSLATTTFSQENTGKNKLKILPTTFSTVDEMRTLYEKEKAKKLDKADECYWRPGDHKVLRSFALTNKQNHLLGVYENSIILYDLDTKEELDTLVHNEDTNIYHVVISHDDKYFAFIKMDASLEIWKLKEIEQVCSMSTGFRFIPTLTAFSQDSNYFFVAANSSHNVKMINIQTKIVEEIPVADGEGIRVMNVIDNNLICGLFDKSIKVFDIDTLKQVQHLEAVFAFGMTAIAVSPDKRFLIASSWAVIKIFNFNTFEEIHEFQGTSDNGWIQSLSVSSDSKYLIAGSEKGSVQVFDLVAQLMLHEFKEIYTKKAIHRLHMSSDSRFIIAGTLNEPVKVFEIMKFHKSRSLGHITSGKKFDIQDLTISHDDRYLIMACRPDRLAIYDLKQKEMSLELPADNHCLKFAITISNDDKYVAFASTATTIQVVDLQSKETTHTFKNANDKEVYSLIISKSNQFLYSVGSDKTLRKFDLTLKEELKILKDAHEGGIMSVQLSSDQKCLVTSSADKSIKIFDSETFGEIYHFKNAHNASVLTANLSSDDKYILSISGDKSMKLFDYETRQEIHCFKSPHKEQMFEVKFSTDNKYIIAPGSDGTVKVFDIKTKREIYHYKISDDSISGLSPLYNGNNFLIAVTGGIQIVPMPFADTTEIFFVSSQIPAFSFLPRFDDVFLKASDPSLRRKTMLTYQDLYVGPYNWTILHLLALTEPQTIPLIATYSDFKVPFLLDHYGRTPLHYITSSDRHDFLAANVLLEYIVCYLQDTTLHSPFECQMILASLSPLYDFILSKMNPSITKKYLELCFPECASRYSETNPSFGQEDVRKIFSKAPVLLPQVKEMIYESGDTQISFRSTMLQLDYAPGSDDMLNIASRLADVKSEEIFSTPIIEKLLDYLWDEMQIILRSLGLFFSALMILLSLYIGWEKRNSGLEIAILIMTLVLLVGEVPQILYQKAKYLKSTWNYIDVTHLLLIIAFVFSRFADIENALAKSWMSTLIIIVGYIRWVSYLRLFDSTRSLIQVIISILYDMMGFVTILAFITFGFAIIFKQFSSNSDGEEIGYGAYFYSTYKIIYGDTDDEHFDISQKFILAFILFLLNVVLLNMLISIMGDTFGRVKDMKVLTDSHTRLDMILEALTVARLFKRGGSGIKGHLIYCGPDLDDEEEEELFKIEEKVDDIKGNIDNVRDQGDEIQYQIMMSEKGTKKRFELLDRKIGMLEQKMVLLEKNSNRIIDLLQSKN